jgi:hypothetical protein
MRSDVAQNNQITVHLEVNRIERLALASQM